jgi:CubicO group peptidase (beta-lactamase class C family)
VSIGVHQHLESLTTSSKTPGLQYLAVDAEQTLLEHYGGWADIGRQEPMEPSTTLTAYSMSKTISAARVDRELVP